MSIELLELTIGDLNCAVGGMRVNPHRPALPRVPGYVGQGDTVDTIPWGGAPGDGSWGILNDNLPGNGMGGF
jgi:hypothetical protein